jgi:glycerol uptake facilitator protein
MTNLLGEFLGTMILIIFGGGVVANVNLKRTKGSGGGWLVITTGWFIAVTLGVFVAKATNAPNADINPAVSLAKYLLHDAYSFPQLIATMGCQTVGAFLGAIIVWLAYLPHWAVTENPWDKLAAFCTFPAIRQYSTNLLNEIIGSFLLVIGIGAIFNHPMVKEYSPGIGPYMVGFLVWGIGLSLGGPTGYAINPARDLGPRLAHQLLPIAGKGSSDWRYAWIPLVGPLVGGALGALIWQLLFH